MRRFTSRTNAESSDMMTRFVNLNRRNFFDKVNRNWDEAWKQKITPWEISKVNPSLMEAFDRSIHSQPPDYNISSLLSTASSRKALIPGCGSGFDAIFINSQGFGEVVGLDISEESLKIAQMNTQAAETTNNILFRRADYFEYSDEVKYDLIYDYLFFSAIEPAMRPKWASKTAELLSDDPSSILLTIIFPCRQDKAPASHVGGPPYEVNLDEYKSVLEPHGLKVVAYNEVCKYVYFLSASIQSLVLGNNVNQASSRKRIHRYLESTMSVDRESLHKNWNICKSRQLVIM